MGEQTKIDYYVSNTPRRVRCATTTCPNCGADVPTRAMLGEGTRRGKETKVNANRKHILKQLNSVIRPLTVQDVLIMLNDKRLPRTSRHGAGWNYHTVQADLSILLGGGFVAMVKPHERELYDPKYGFTTNRLPLYKITEKGRVEVTK